MIDRITIKNYKSVSDLDIELGRVNIFIGENGCGKSNILEAISLGSAAAENKLDNEFLASRGIRVTEPALMRSGFDQNKTTGEISIGFYGEQFHPYILKNKNNAFSQWEIADKPTAETLMTMLKEDGFDISKLISKDSPQPTKNQKPKSKILPHIEKIIDEYWLESTKIDSGFLIYAPENHFLRRFEEEAQIQPLGIRGEGLFKLLTVLQNEKPEQLAKIMKSLELFDWFNGFEISNGSSFEKKLVIKDRFLKDGISVITQRSANEGFLFLLFYFSLIVSNYTPAFFAIDNIDTSLNPRLSMKFMQTLVTLSKEHNKQIIATTHSPALLDGLDLDDNDQRLFVIYRNADGFTKARRVQKRKSLEGIEKVRNSEAFIRGYFGGLPENF